MGASPHYIPLVSQFGARVWGLVTYPLHPESSTAVHHVKKVIIFLAPEPVQSCNLEIAPKVAHVVRFAFHAFRVDVGQRSRSGFRVHDFFGQRLLVLGIFLWQILVLFDFGFFDKHFPETLGSQVVRALVSRGVPEDIGHCFLELFDRNRESIGLVVALHVNKRITAFVSLNFLTQISQSILGNVAKVLDLGLEAPVPSVLLQQRVLVKVASEACQFLNVYFGGYSYPE